MNFMLHHVRGRPENNNSDALARWTCGAITTHLPSATSFWLQVRPITCRQTSQKVQAHHQIYLLIVAMVLENGMSTIQ